MCLRRNLVFIHSVFWDLYCAAPERRDSCEHSSEAKAFHDYVSIPVTSFSVFSADQYSGLQRGNVALCERSTRYIRPIRYCTWKSLYLSRQFCVELLLIYIQLFTFHAVPRTTTATHFFASRFLSKFFFCVRLNEWQYGSGLVDLGRGP